MRFSVHTTPYKHNLSNLHHFRNQSDGRPVNIVLTPDCGVENSIQQHFFPIASQPMRFQAQMEDDDDAMED